MALTPRQELYARHKSAGLCVACGGTRPEGSTRVQCDECLAKKRALRAKLIGERLCLNCRRPAYARRLGGRVLCATCRNTEKRNRYAKLSAGICQHCSRPVDPGKTACRVCLDRTRNYHRRTRTETETDT